MDDEDEAENDDVEPAAIATEALHLVAPDEAVAIFDAAIGTGGAWASPLMQYRTTSDFQRDWKVEVGNWLERARSLGYLAHVQRNIVSRHQVTGKRDAGDDVHRGVIQQLAQAMATHYFVGTGWTLQAWEPNVTEPRRNGTRADVDLQLRSQTGVVVDFQVKASGRLGLHDNTVDPHIQQGVRNAADQLPIASSRPSLIVMAAQRDFPLSADIQVIEGFIGDTAQYPDDTVLLHDDHRGELFGWRHVSGIIALDHLRGLEDSSYGCVLLQNPWADHPVDAMWFPHARILTSASDQFTWLHPHPYTTIPTGTRCFAGTTRDAMRMHGERRRGAR